MCCMFVAPPAAEMKLGSSHAEHSLMGMLGSWSRIARIAVMDGGPGTRPNRMICGLALSSDSTWGVMLVAVSGTVWVATSLKWYFWASCCTVCWLAVQTGPQALSMSATRVMCWGTITFCTDASWSL